MAAARKGNGKGKRGVHNPYTKEERLQAIEAFRQSGMGVDEFADTWGVSGASMGRWLAAFEAGGEAALVHPDGRGRPKGTKKPVPQPVKNAVMDAKEEFPFFGVRRIQSWCERAFGLGVSRQAVQETLAEAGIAPQKKRKKPRAKKVRFFERAKPMQMWQSDITQFVCPRTGKRIFLCVFLDDRSRYVVGWSVSARQTTEMVLEAYEMGVGRYGRPEEALTDQGRQYSAWRGRTDFQERLKRDGVKHIVSRSHHPQTLGKCERLWQTVKEEFWARVEVTDVEDAKKRLEHWFGHYNFFRPHQTLDNAAPAERFFGVVPEMRAAIEATVAKNAEALAIGEKPRQPFYMAARIGDENVAIAAERGGLVIATAEKTRRIDYADLGEAVGTGGVVPELPVSATAESAPTTTGAVSDSATDAQAPGIIQEPTSSTDPTDGIPPDESAPDLLGPVVSPSDEPPASGGAAQAFEAAAAHVA